MGSLPCQSTSELHRSRSADRMDGRNDTTHPSPVDEFVQTGSSAPPAIELESVTQTYVTGDTAQTVMSDLDIAVTAGSFTSVVGPSGCGKSTLLNFMAGLTHPTSGTARVLGRPPIDVRDQIGFIFQSDALLPWRTARENVALPLRFRGVNRRTARATADEWLDRVGLPGSGHKYPHQLSGGQRKRVSIASTLIYEPRVLLMDEPFSALDVQTRDRMENDLLSLWAGMNQTVVFVTHDLEEAVGLSDRVIVLSAGPAEIRGDHRIDLARPRDLQSLRFTPRFRELCEAVWRDLPAAHQDPQDN